MTSLHNLVGNAKGIREALEAGADPDERDAAGNTPLHSAGWGADLDAVRALLAHGADVSARNQRGVPVLHEAARRGNTGVAILLARAGAPVSDHAGDDGSTPLHWAARDGDLELAKVLLERGASLEAVDRLGRTPLQWVLPRAGYSDLGEMTRFLLSTGAGHSLEDAIARGTREHVAHWLGRGTAPGARLADGGSALGLAAEKAAVEVVQLLIEAGASPNGEPFDARSPLVRALAGGHMEVVEILLQAGAGPEGGGSDGILPLDEHVERMRIHTPLRPGPCGELLIAHGARPTPQWAVVRDDPEVLAEALARGWDVDRLAAGDTALVLAAGADRPRMVAALLAAGADPRLAGKHGRTPLHAAAEPCESRTEVAKLLLDAGADPNARDGRGRSPLHVALEMVHSFCVSLEMVEVLVAGGADPELRDAAGKLPMEMDRPDFLHVDVRGDAAEVSRRRDAAVAAVSDLLGRAAFRRNADVNVAARLGERAARHPERLAIADPRRRLTFGELDRRVHALAGGLARRGIGPGDAVLLFVPMSADLYVALLACLHRGATAVFVDAWADRRRLDAAVRIAAPKAFIGTPKAHLLRLLSPAVRRIPVHLVAGRGLLSLRRYEAEGAAEATAVEGSAPALVTFTTGSTGAPKAAARSHAFLWAQHRALAGHLRPAEGDVDMPTLPVFVLNNLACGVPSVIPDFDPRLPSEVDPERILRQMAAEGVTTSSGSPAFYDRLGRWCARRGRRIPLRALWTGGAPVLPPLARLLASVADGAVGVVYGSSEAEPIAGIGAREMLAAMDGGAAEGICVGRPVPEVEVRLIRPADGPVALGEGGWAAWEVGDGEVGEVVVAGEHVLAGYLHDPEAERLNKIPDGARVWHRTGDAARMDREGRLWLMGRVKERVVREGRTWWPGAAEVRALEVDGVRHAAYLGMPDGRAVLCVETGRGRLTDAQREALRTALGPMPCDEIRALPRIPRDPRHASKTDVGALREVLGGATRGDAEG